MILFYRLTPRIKYWKYIRSSADPSLAKSLFWTAPFVKSLILDIFSYKKDLFSVAEILGVTSEMICSNIVKSQIKNSMQGIRNAKSINTIPLKEFPTLKNYNYNDFWNETPVKSILEEIRCKKVIPRRRKTNFREDDKKIDKSESSNKESPYEQIRNKNINERNDLLKKLLPNDFGSSRKKRKYNRRNYGPESKRKPSGRIQMKKPSAHSSVLYSIIKSTKSPLKINSIPPVSKMDLDDFFVNRIDYQKGKRMLFQIWDSFNSPEEYSIVHSGSINSVSFNWCGRSGKKQILSSGIDGYFRGLDLGAQKKKFCGTDQISEEEVVLGFEKYYYVFDVRSGKREIKLLGGNGFPISQNMAYSHTISIPTKTGFRLEDLRKPNKEFYAVEYVPTYGSTYCQVEMSAPTNPKEKALGDYRSKLKEHKEVEARLKEMRESLKELTKQYDKSENDLKALQSRKFIVKATNGPRYVVGCRRQLDKSKLKPGTRVALDMTTLTIMRYLPREVDPLVYNMSHEDPGEVTYSNIGGLAEQIRELREVIELPPTQSRTFPSCWNLSSQGLSTLWSPRNRKNPPCSRNKYIGESARLIREMFNYARDHQPCIIFMDEIDAIGGRRFSEGTSADREIQRTLMELLNQMGRL
ncbi:PSMC6 [Lepeophtheirus salmonis]|uniref:PSMC6 n=1 Tax=Lepeophtheirus salmonis TaxID=72036 RepID=A0A7R8D3X0_LEPSM|nr:PSMC6 [Lepeophtheirus salmonis]CAF3020578.1 PSMC6 [Lepeophtheirus salmonis]